MRILAALAAFTLMGIAPSTPAFALPTAAFKYSPSLPVVNQTVKFNGTASICDVTPCRYQWTWYRLDGRLGATMGEGKILYYKFTTAGYKRVVLKVTNSTPTHGSSTKTKYVLVSTA